MLKVATIAAIRESTNAGRRPIASSWALCCSSAPGPSPDQEEGEMIPMESTQKVAL